MKYRYDYEEYLPYGYLIYDVIDIDCTSKRIGIGIPQELNGNKIVINKFPIVRSNFYKLKETLDDAIVQNKILKSKYLDIEKKPYKQQLSILKEEVFKCREEMNKDLSPYHWDWLNFKNMDLLVLSNSNEYYKDYLLDEIYRYF